MITDDYKDIEASYISDRMSESRDDRDSRDSKDGLSAMVTDTPPLPYTELREARNVILSLLQSYSVEEITLENSKVVLLDPHLCLLYAFKAMEEHGTRSAPIFDLERKTFVGVLSFASFVEALLQFFDPADETRILRSFYNYSIETWMSQRQWFQKQWDEYVPHNASLHRACCALREKKVHRLPVFASDDNTVVDLITHVRILRFVHERLQYHGHHRSAPFASLFNAKLRDLGIGSFQHLVRITFQTSVLEALELFCQYNLSCLPVCDASGVLVDQFQRPDVADFIGPSSDRINLNLTVEEVISRYRRRPAVLEVCSLESSLQSIFEQFDRSRVHRLYCVKDGRQLIGVVSLGDVFSSFL